MTDYDSMCVEDLLWEYSKWGEDTTERDYEASEKKGKAIVSALRKAVIREARVGTIEFNSAFEDGIGVVLGDDLDGDYDLIPKEKP